MKLSTALKLGSGIGAAVFAFGSVIALGSPLLGDREEMLDAVGRMVPLVIGGLALNVTCRTWLWIREPDRKSNSDQ
jgi:hypothetical protein